MIDPCISWDSRSITAYRSLISRAISRTPKTCSARLARNGRLFFHTADFANQVHQQIDLGLVDFEHLAGTVIARMVAIWRIATGGSRGGRSARRNRLAPSGENSRELLSRFLTIRGRGCRKRFDEIATAGAARKINRGRSDRNDPLARLDGIGWHAKDALLFVQNLKQKGRRRAPSRARSPRRRMSKASAPVQSSGRPLAALSTRAATHNGFGNRALSTATSHRRADASKRSAGVSANSASAALRIA